MSARIVQQRYTERLLNELDDAFCEIPSFTAHVGQLEAVLPAVEETPATKLNLPAYLPPPTRLERFFSRDRLSTDELYDDIEESLHLRPSFILTVVLSAIIAGLGMRSGQTAVVIGAMIIAPLLGPTMGIALAATVGNWQLGKQAMATLAVGCALAVLAGFGLGAIIDIDPTVPELQNRTLVQPADVALALACGAAGVLAFSRGASLALVEVMIAVSGITMFLFQGLPPKNWRMTTGIVLIWLLLLVILMSLMAGRVILGFGSLETLMDHLIVRV